MDRDPALTRSCTTAVAALALALAPGCGAGDGEDRRGSGGVPNVVLDYHREYRTAPSGSSADLRVTPDGAATSVGGEPGQPCSSGKARFRLEPTELERLRRSIARARESLHEASEAPKPATPELRIATPDDTAHYETIADVPRDVRPLIADVERLIKAHCPVVTP